MPKREDIKKILIVGSGPIIIGQACEFDYSGTQACKALKEEGYTVILLNSNPATIMTDPDFSDRTYIEPITPGTLERIIRREHPDALLPTLGGQTGLNTAVQAAEEGILEKYNVEMIGADIDVIKKAEERDRFKSAMNHIGLDQPRSGWARELKTAEQTAKEIGFPVIIRPSFTLAGTGGGVAYNIEEFRELASRGLDLSLTTEILIEESLLGWKEFELEVMRDIRDNVVIVCSIENMCPMGVHTGDSVTVAPQQTLTDAEYQVMRDSAIKIMREIGVETGGSNVQFAVDPQSGRQVVIEMNPRVSRSSALASKATGFPIAKIAAKLAVGYTLDELRNDITRETSACFEPSIDYCVIKIPRFTFEKFPEAAPYLSTSMKSIGEVMAIGRTFKEALNKGARSLETGLSGLSADYSYLSDDELRDQLIRYSTYRFLYIYEALKRGFDVKSIIAATEIDPWFIYPMADLWRLEKQIIDQRLTHDLMLTAKQHGFSDATIAALRGISEEDVRTQRKALEILPTYKLVDTCAAEFEAYTPYYYSTYERENENRITHTRKIIVLGGGPNRIGQGIEFDYCCVQAIFALKQLGFEAIMVNSNPETVSTDYDTSDKLYFEPLTYEDVMNIIDEEHPDGVIVQFGGQTPLNLAQRLTEAGAPIIGTSMDSINRAEDREDFAAMIDKLGLLQPPNRIVHSMEEAYQAAKEVGYPVVIRPSFVLGGRKMEIVYEETELTDWFADLRNDPSLTRLTILIDKFLEDAVELDVDLVSDGQDIMVGGIMEHIEEAGIHSGDSASVLPPFTFSDEQIAEITRQVTLLARELNVIGLMNVQMAFKGDDLYIIEVNPRASRTVPFISKATGVPLAKIATRVMCGASLADLGLAGKTVIPAHTAVKESVFPFNRFPGIDTILSPEMKSTGEVMGIDSTFELAFAKSQYGAGQLIPKQGTIFISVKDRDKPAMADIAKRLADMDFTLIATEGTAGVLQEAGIPVTAIRKLSVGRPNILDYLANGEVNLIINTPSGKKPRRDEVRIRSTSVKLGVPLITTLSGARATLMAIESLRNNKYKIKPLQEYYDV